MKKKGFTLIELLAVIVVLAIIALIAMPLIMNVIDEAKKGAAISSGYEYIRTIELEAVNHMAQGGSKLNGTYTTKDSDLYDASNKLILDIEMKGQTPADGGTINIKDNIVIDANIIIGNYELNYDGKDFSAEVPLLYYWGIDANNKLIISDVAVTSAVEGQSGSFKRNASFYEHDGQAIGISTTPWKNYNNSITSVEVVAVNEKVAPISTAGWFYMLTKAESFNLTGLDTSNVTDMSSMFMFCQGITTLDVQNFNTENVTDMSNMFTFCDKLGNLNFTGWDTSKVVTMKGMFLHCQSMTTINLTNFNTENVTNMSGMFSNCHKVTNLVITSFNTENVIDMSTMFASCRLLTNLNLSHFKTQNVTNMRNMFNDCQALTTLNISGFDTRNVTDMSEMFRYSLSLTTLNLDNFITSNVVTMKSMFHECESLTSVSMKNATSEKLEDVSWMFGYDTKLKTVDIRKISTNDNMNLHNMFDLCEKMTVYVSSSADITRYKDANFITDFDEISFIVAS